MNWLDWLLLALLVMAALNGLFQGLMKSLFGLGGLTVSILVAGRFYATLAPNLSFVHQPDAARVLAFVLIVLAIWVLAYIAGRVMSKVLSRLSLGWVDRLGGAILGLGLAWVGLGALLALTARYPWINLDTALRSSWLASALVKGFPLVLGLLPADFDSLRQFYQ